MYYYVSEVCGLEPVQIRTEADVFHSAELTSKLFGTKIVTLFTKGNIVFSLGGNKAGKFDF